MTEEPRWHCWCGEDGPGGHDEYMEHDKVHMGEIKRNAEARIIQLIEVCDHRNLLEII